MGLRNFLDDIIPNELKKSNLAKIALGAGAVYAGFKFGPSVYNAAKQFIGRPEQLNMPFDQKSPATGMFKMAQNLKKYSDNPLVKFGQGFIGKGRADEQPDNSTYLAEMKALNERYTTNPYSQAPVPVGTFTSTTASAGFNNMRVQEGLINLASYMKDLQDNGRIDSSALYAEGTRGTTLKVGAGSPKQLRQI